LVVFGAGVLVFMLPMYLKHLALGNLMMLYADPGVMAPAFLSASCWVRYGIILYVYAVCGKLCVGVVLCGTASRKHPLS
jgi:hypothetical protein